MCHSRSEHPKLTHTSSLAIAMEGCDLIVLIIVDTYPIYIHSTENNPLKVKAAGPIPDKLEVAIA